MGRPARTGRHRRRDRPRAEPGGTCRSASTSMHYRPDHRRRGEEVDCQRMRPWFILTAAWVAMAIGCSPAPPAASTAPQGPPAPVLASLSAAVLNWYIAAVVEANHAVGDNIGVMRNGEVVLA